MNKLLFGLFAFVFLVGLFAINAYDVMASSTINSATLNGASTVAVSPNSTITASVSVTSSNGVADRWKCTKYLVEGQVAVKINTANHQGDTASESFSITAPSNDGTYDVSFTTYSDE